MMNKSAWLAVALVVAGGGAPMAQEAAPTEPETPAAVAAPVGDEAAVARVVLNWPAALSLSTHAPYGADVRSQTELDALRGKIESWARALEYRDPEKVDFSKERVLVFSIYGFDGDVTVEATRELPDGTVELPVLTKAGTRRAVVGIALPAIRREICVTRRQDGDQASSVLLRVPADPADQPFAKLVECRYGFFGKDEYPDRLAGTEEWVAGMFGGREWHNLPWGARPLDVKDQPLRNWPYRWLERDSVRCFFWSRKASSLRLSVKKEFEWWRLEVQEEGEPRADGRAAALFALVKRGQTCLLPKGWMYELHPLRQATWRAGGRGDEPAKLVVIKTLQEWENASVPAEEWAKLGQIDFRRHHLVLLSRGVPSGPGVLQPTLYVTPDGEIKGSLGGVLKDGEVPLEKPADMPGVCWAAAVVPALSELPQVQRDGFLSVTPTLMPEKPISGVPANADDVDLMTATSLTAEQAWTIVKRQAGKPELPAGADPGEAALQSAGATPEQIQRVRSEMAKLGLTDRIRVSLLEFLDRSTSPDMQRLGNGFRDFLALPALTSISPEAAEELAHIQVKTLQLTGLKALSPEAAAKLKPVRRNLVLSGLTDLTPELAVALTTGVEGWLDISGLTALTPEVAAALVQARNTKRIRLDGLTAVAPAAAASLMKFGDGGAVSLSGLTTLAPDVAAVLARFEGTALHLNGLTTLTPESAAALVTVPPMEPAADQFARQMALMKDRGRRMQFVLDLSLPTLAPKTAAELAKFSGRHLVLRGPATLSPESAAALATFAGCSREHAILTLAGLTTLTPEVAGALAKFHGRELNLPGLTAIAPEAAAELKKVRSNLSLPGLTTLSAAAAKALTEAPGWDGELPNVTAIDADTAAALADFKGQRLALWGLTTLPPESAAALATFAGKELSVPRLESLPPESAAALVACGRWDGSLPRLRTLTPETAAALAKFQGRLIYLGGLTDLSAGAAAALAQSAGPAIDLRGLTDLAPEAAAALAQWKGFTEFPGACRLSDRATQSFFQHPLTPETALAWAQLSSGQLAITAFDSPDSEAIAKALATRKGLLALPHLRKISPRTLTALIEKRDVRIPLIETLELIPEPDGSLTEEFVIPEWLKERQEQEQERRPAWPIDDTVGIRPR